MNLYCKNSRPKNNFSKKCSIGSAQAVWWPLCASCHLSAAQEVAAWIDLRVSSAAGVREAALHLDPLYRALAIAYFGSAHVIELETSDPATICREGLDWIAATARSQHAEEFLSLDQNRQLALLHSISDERAATQNENPGTRFFAFLKSETIRGFYTSHAGLQELDFKGNAFYARSPGCDSK